MLDTGGPARLRPASAPPVLGHRPAAPGANLALALAMIVAIVWGLCFVLIKASAPGPVPLLHAGLRSLLGGAFLIGWMALRGVARRGGRGGTGATAVRQRPLTLADWPMLGVLALANSTLAFGAMYLTAGRAETAVASVLAGGQPLVLAAAGWLLFGDRVGRRAGLGFALAAAGIVLMATSNSGSTSLGGIALAVVATVAPGLGTVLMRRVGPELGLVRATGIQFALGGLVLLAASALLEPWSRIQPGAGLVLDVVVQGLAGTGLAYVAWFWLLSRVTLVRLATILYAVPVTGLVASIVAGDRPGPIVLLGSVIVLGGIVLSTARPASEDAAGAAIPRSTPHAP